MNNLSCIEQMNNILAVWTFKSGEVNYSFPFNVRKRIVLVSELGISSIAALTGSRQHYEMGAVYDDTGAVSIDETGNSLKSTTKKSSSGRYHEVILTLIVTENSSASIGLMDELESEEHDFIIKCANGEYLLLRISDLAYNCSVEESFDDDKYSQKITVTMECYNGIQRISESAG